LAEGARVHQLLEADRHDGIALARDHHARGAAEQRVAFDLDYTRDLGTRAVRRRAAQLIADDDRHRDAELRGPCANALAQYGVTANCIAPSSTSRASAATG
jgi:hypothetical protein